MDDQWSPIVDAEIERLYGRADISRAYDDARIAAGEATSAYRALYQALHDRTRKLATLTDRCAITHKAANAAMRRLIFLLRET